MFGFKQRQAEGHRSVPPDYFLFSSSDLFLSSSLLAGSPRLAAMTGPGLALWCSRVAAPPLVALVSTSWTGCEDAFESPDSFATWSVMLPVASSSLGWTGMLMDLIGILMSIGCCLVPM